MTCLAGCLNWPFSAWQFTHIVIHDSHHTFHVTGFSGISGTIHSKTAQYQTCTHNGNSNLDRQEIQVLIIIIIIINLIYIAQFDTNGILTVLEIHLYWALPIMDGVLLRLLSLFFFFLSVLLGRALRLCCKYEIHCLSQVVHNAVWFNAGMTLIWRSETSPTCSTFMLLKCLMHILMHTSGVLGWSWLFMCLFGQKCDKTKSVFQWWYTQIIIFLHTHAHIQAHINHTLFI